MELTEGMMVTLRDGSTRGPLRDRKNENSYWPWGEKCPHCGHPRYDGVDGLVWRPNGRASEYGYEREHPHDIISANGQLIPSAKEE